MHYPSDSPECLFNSLEYKDNNPPVDSNSIKRSIHRPVLEETIRTINKDLDDRQIRLLDSTFHHIISEREIKADIFITNSSYSPREICLDSCAGESIFMNIDLFHDLEISESPLIVRGVNSDSAPMIVSYEGSTIFGIVYYSENCVANVLSLGCAIDTSYKIRYLHHTDQFLLQVSEGGDTYIFKRNIGTNTYICDLDKNVQDCKYIHNNNIVLVVRR